MSHPHENRYCTRCRKTTRFQVAEALFTCSLCGVQVSQERREGESRTLIGDPFHNFRVSFG